MQIQVFKGGRTSLRSVAVMKHPGPGVQEAMGRSGRHCGVGQLCVAGTAWVTLLSPTKSPETLRQRRLIPRAPSTAVLPSACPDAAPPARPPPPCSPVSQDTPVLHIQQPARGRGYFQLPGRRLTTYPAVPSGPIWLAPVCLRVQPGFLSTAGELKIASQ